MRKKGKLGFIIWGVVSIVLVVAMIAANVVTTTYKSIISTYLNQPMTEIVGGDSGDEAVYYDAELSEQQLVKQGKKLCEEIVSEGIVLLENNDMEADNGDYTLSVKVANVGGTAGKSSVQFYMSAPYIPGSGVERAAVELVEFEKTDILEPGADETLTVTVPKEYLKAYNAEGEGGYVVQGGDYYFTAAFNAHDAVNDILAAKEGKSELSASPLPRRIPWRRTRKPTRCPPRPATR